MRPELSMPVEKINYINDTLKLLATPHIFKFITNNKKTSIYYTADKTCGEFKDVLIKTISIIISLRTISSRPDMANYV